MIAAAMPKTPNGARHGGALKLHRVPGFGEVSIAQRQPQSRANPPVAQSGTALAINYLTSGVAAFSGCSDGAQRNVAPPPQAAGATSASAVVTKQAGRGGARNFADKVSYALTAANVANLKAAERHARVIGLPFTRMISIHWEGAGVPLVGMVKATGRFTDLLTKALARHGSRTAWLWVLENGHGKGGHCHLLAHVPAGLVAMVTSLQRGWLRRITLRSYRARVIRSRPIGKRLGDEINDPADHAINLEVALAYVLKGASLEAAVQFDLMRLEPGGLVIGKRCSTSQNIGRASRASGPSLCNFERLAHLAQEGELACANLSC